MIIIIFIIIILIIIIVIIIIIIIITIINKILHNVMRVHFYMYVYYIIYVYMYAHVNILYIYIYTYLYMYVYVSELLNVVSLHYLWYLFYSDDLELFWWWHCNWYSASNTGYSCLMAGIDYHGQLVICACDWYHHEIFHRNHQTWQQPYWHTTIDLENLSQIGGQLRDLCFIIFHQIYQQPIRDLQS